MALHYACPILCFFFSLSSVQGCKTSNKLPDMRATVWWRSVLNLVRSPSSKTQRPHLYLYIFLVALAECWVCEAGIPLLRVSEGSVNLFLFYSCSAANSAGLYIIFPFSWFPVAWPRYVRGNIFAMDWYFGILPVEKWRKCERQGKRHVKIKRKGRWYETVEEGWWVDWRTELIAHGRS